jgi:hypothetical protein
MSRTTLRPTVAALSLIIAVVAAVVLPAGAASAAAYRYWGFFQLQGSTWAFATKGPDQVTPPDGSVEGWRFAVAGESDSRTPRASATFDQLCGSTAAESGKKRVGLVMPTQAVVQLPQREGVEISDSQPFCASKSQSPVPSMHSQWPSRHV